MSARSLIAGLVALLAASAALGHTKLATSVPAAESKVAAPVSEIVLEFSEPVQLTAVTLTDAAGAAQALDALPRERAARFTLGVRATLAPGAYVIAWRAVGADTHLVSGNIPFEITGAAHSH